MKAILKNGQPIYQSHYKVWIDENGSQTSTKGATVQQWIDWGFKDVVIPEFNSSTQKLGDWYETETEITRYVINKSEQEINAELDDFKNQSVLQFESDTDNLIRQIIGERGSEYEIAEQEAIAFKAAGYPDGDVPASVSSDAIANGYSNTIACDLIITMADNWRALQAALRANRLLGKANAKNATSNSELATIEETWNTFLVTIKSQIIE